MEAGKIVYHANEGGQDVTIRYPEIGDLNDMLEYINTISKEKTYITYQGEQISLEEEEKYLNGQLEKLKRNEIVQLILLVNGKMSGVTSVELDKKIKSHVATFGITVSIGERGKGLGKLLMKSVLDEAWKNLSGLKIIALEVFGENERAHNMYKSFGFTEYGRLPKGLKYREGFSDSILMFKTTTQP